MNREKQIEESFIRKLTEQLKYVYRDDIHDRASLEANFRQKFETLNKVKLSIPNLIGCWRRLSIPMFSYRRKVTRAKYIYP